MYSIEKVSDVTNRSPSTRRTFCWQYGLKPEPEVFRDVIVAHFPVVTRFREEGLQTHPSQEPLIYKKFFERISIWNQKYDYKPGENDEFSGIQTIDKLYEKFCLFKIIDIIIDSGYELIKSDNSKFIFSDKAKTIELFHELDFSAGKNSYG